MPLFQQAVEMVGLIIDGMGVAVIAVWLAVAVFRFVAFGRRTAQPYRKFRQDLGRGILLGLEFLVASDIIRTVAVTPTLQGVLILGLVVLIRTVLSMALQVELEGKWPWQKSAEHPPPTPSET